MPPLHPLVVHFPIALFCIGILFDCITAYRLRGVPSSDRRRLKAEISILNPASRLIMILGFLGAIVAVISGEWLKVQRGAFLPHGLLELHQLLAFLFTAWYAAILFFRLHRHWRPSKGYLALAIMGVLILTAVGHTGGSMAWPNTHAVSPLAVTSGTGSAKQGGGTIAANAKNQEPQSKASSQKANQLSKTENLAHGTLNDTQKKINQNHSTVKKASTQVKAAPHTTSARTATAKPAVSPTQAHTVAFDQAKYDNGYRLFVSSCQSCHSLGTATQYYGRLSDSQWRQVVGQMQSYAGGSIPNTEDIIYYLDHHK